VTFISQTGGTPSPVPADHGVWLDDNKHVRPVRPRVAQVGQLLAKGGGFRAPIPHGFGRWNAALQEGS
jgi:hypothetical protein